MTPTRRTFTALLAASAVALPRFSFALSAARNVGLRACRGAVIALLDPSVELTGDAFGPLLAALADASVGAAGPFGLVNFVDQMARIGQGLAIYCNAGELGGYVLDRFVRGRRSRKKLG